MELKKFVIVIICSALFVSTQLVAQTPDSLEWYPLQVGNVWVYQNWYPDTTQITYRIVEDTVDPSGVRWFGRQINHAPSLVYLAQIDSIIYKGMSREDTLYQLPLRPGTCFPRGSAAVGVVTDTFQMQYGGEVRTGARIDFFGGQCDSTDLYMYTETLARGIGLIEEFYEPMGGRSLIGAIIDSTRYGTLVGIQGIGKSESSPATLRLYGNYPNPFNLSTTIVYDLPSPGHVTIRIYSIRGELIKKISRGIESSGKRSVVWNGTDAAGNEVSSGVYIVQVQLGKHIERVKITLVK